MAERVIIEGRAEYAEAGKDGLAVVAKLVYWGGQLAKVSVVAVPYGDRHVLQRQEFPVGRQPVTAIP